MKIGIIGIGVVGSALYHDFLDKNINVIPYDKYKNIGSINDIYETNLVFLCLPTPFDENMKQYNKLGIYDVCQNLSKNNYQGLVVLKSTVEPETTSLIEKLYNLSICHNPEFLSASSAKYDFKNQQHIVIGTNKSDITILINFYNTYYPNANISVCTSNESELMKLAVNNFYSVKIQFFNELYSLSNKIDANFNTIKELMIKNGWIHPMHTQVPGTDGKLSYGGMCFPKDTNALLNYMKIKNTPHRVLDNTVIERNEMRKD